MFKLHKSMDHLTVLCNVIIKNTKHFISQDVPELLTLSANTLRKSKLFPTSYKEFFNYTQSDCLDVIPVLSSLFVVVSSILLFTTSCFTVKQNSSAKHQKVRSYLIRVQALCYASGFLTSAIQHRTLWGEHGLMPANANNGRPKPIFSYIGFGDVQLEFVSWFGLYLCLLFVKYESMVVAASLWASYLSIVNMKAAFTFSYGWEWLTCENGFLMIFLCSPPFISILQKRHTKPYDKVPVIVVCLIRFLAFRLLLGAGMSKVGRNSSACWRDLTCTTTHYETQPIPNPLSWYFHLKLPVWAHKVEVALTFFEQLMLPYLMLVPHRWFRCFSAAAEIFFQFCIVGTGNYAWINYVGILPCIALFDDDFIEMVENRIFSPIYSTFVGTIDKIINCTKDILPFTGAVLDPENEFDPNSLSLEDKNEIDGIIVEELTEQLSTMLVLKERTKCQKEGVNKHVEWGLISNISKILNAMRAVLTGTILSTYHLSIICLLAFMTYKAKDPIKELFGPAPWINAYDDYFFMTSQGVFGFINKMRIQVVMEYTHDTMPPYQWKELDFKCIPGGLHRRPCFLSPYHSRLDWETWIRVTAGFEHVVDSNQYPPQQLGLVMQYNTPPFLGKLSEKILQGDENAARLLGTPLNSIYPISNASENIPRKLIPSKIRFRYYLYQFADDNRSFLTVVKSKLQNVVTRITFNWVTMGEKIVDKPWWKRKEFKTPEEHFQVFKRLGNNNIQRFHQRVSYHNSSQFRHWILGATIIMAFISLGTKFNGTYSSLRKWSEQRNESSSIITRLLHKIFCPASNERIVYKILMARGVKVWKCLSEIKHIRQPKETQDSAFLDKTISKDDAHKIHDSLDDDEWESVEGYEGATIKPEISKCFENPAAPEMKIKEAEVNASAERLKYDLRMAISNVINIESFSFGSFFQHILSFVIFGVALMIDYKDKVVESRCWSYEFIGICAAASIAITVIRLQQHKSKLVVILISKMSLFLEFVMVVINVCIVKWAKDASTETTIPYDIV